jgi:hypothetical protein
MDRFLRTLVASGVVVLFVLAPAWGGSLAHAQDAAAKFDPAVRPEFSEPVTLASKDGVLEVTLTAHQGEVRLDTVAKPVKNFLVFAYDLVRGTASNGQTSGDNLYPAPTLRVSPGGQLTGQGAVKIYSSGSLLQGGPATYLQSPEHTPIVTFTEMASFTPFDGASGVRVAATSTTTAATFW